MSLARLILAKLSLANLSFVQLSLVKLSVAKIFLAKLSIWENVSLQKRNLWKLSFAKMLLCKKVLVKMRLQDVPVPFSPALGSSFRGFYRLRLGSGFLKKGQALAHGSWEPFLYFFRLQFRLPLNLNGYSSYAQLDQIYFNIKTEIGCN